MLRLNQWIQNNASKTLGTLVETFNIDLESNRGRVRTTRAKRITSTAASSEFLDVAAMKLFDGSLYLAVQGTGSHEIWVGGNTPFDTFTRDTSSININPLNADMEVFNSALYAVSGTVLSKTTDGTAWSTVDTSGAALDSNSAHLLCVFEPDGNGERLYITDDNYRVTSVSTGDAIAADGATYTLNTNSVNHDAKILMAGTNKIWLGLSSGDNGKPSLMFEWDGVTANAPSRKFYVNGRIMAGIIKDDIPYIVNSFGQLLVFTGASFKEIARFPLNGRTFKAFANTGHNDHAIHPRGMAVDGDEILINVANRTDGVTSDNFNEFPSGVWAYNERNGLYHKLSPSYQAVADTGVTNLTDHGQYRCYIAGPMTVVEPILAGGDTVANNGGRVLFSMEYFVDADDSSADTQWGIFADDTRDNTQKAGYFVTAQFPGQAYKDHWNELYAALSELETSGDLVEIKYRMKDEEPTYVTAEWNGTDRFNTDTELTDYEAGHEVQVVQGTGAGACAHIKTLETGAGSSVILERDLTGVTGTSKVRLENWTKVGKIEDLAPDKMTIGEKGNFIQFKVYMQWTGAREFYELLAINKPSITT